jgi:hypothetical protein
VEEFPAEGEGDTFEDGGARSEEEDATLVGVEDETKRGSWGARLMYRLRNYKEKAKIQDELRSQAPYHWANRSVRGCSRMLLLPGYRAKKPARDSNPESPDDFAP